MSAGVVAMPVSAMPGANDAELTPTTRLKPAEYPVIFDRVSSVVVISKPIIDDWRVIIQPALAGLSASARRH
jgi:hypothetical protein